jgi:hypothetical protein
VPPNYYDKASRFAAKLDPVEFIGWLLGLPAEAFAFRGWLDTRGLPFPGDPDRVTDTVARVEDAGRHGVPWAVAVEFQTQPDPTMFGRLLGYLSELWLNRRPDEERGSRFQLGAAVVNRTGSGSTSREMSWPAAGLHAQLRIAERNLEREPAAGLLSAIESGARSRSLLPWIPLMSGGGDADTIDRWKALAETEPDRRRKAEYGGIALIFAERAGHKDIWKQKLEGWNVEESTVVNEWMAIGEARGEARGEVREAQATILRLGAKKFGPAAEGVEAMVKAMEDRPRLERLIDRILDAAGWDDLLASP